MALNRDLFLRKKVGQQLVSVELPSGGEVLLQPATARLYRDYKRSLRDKDGMVIADKQAYGDELLIAALLVDDAGVPLLTDADVMAGALDGHAMSDLMPIIRKAYEIIGFADVSDEGREKNSSATASIEPS